MSGLADATTASSEITVDTSLVMDLSPAVAEPSGLSVEWADSLDTRSMDESVLQISGAGHWFLEGWIGNHSVDFLVDSGSAVSALSCSFYQTLVRAGAPVGTLQTTSRKLWALTARLLTYWDACLVWCRSWGSRRSSPLSCVI